MTDTAYHLAAVPEPVTALGKKLRPFSLGHRLILEREQSAFISGEPPTFSDLIHGVTVCSRTFSGYFTFLQSPFAALSLKLWGFKIWLAVRFGGKNLAQSAAHFAEYISHGSTTPSMSVKEGGEPIRCPMVSLVKVYLQSHLGYSQAEVMELPWGQAVWEYTIHAALEGHCKLLDAEATKELKELSQSTPEEIERMIAAGRKAGLNV